MSYKVTGAAAVVELDDGKPEIGTGRRIYLEQNQQVPADAKAAHVEHLLAIGLVEATGDAPAADEVDDDPDGPGPMPAKSASRADWDDYAATQGLTPEEVAAFSSKEDLQKHFGVS